MALIKCRECGNQVSTEAAACPHCGAPQKAAPPPVQPTVIVQHAPPPKKKIGFFSGCLLVIFLCMVFTAIVGSIVSNSTSQPAGNASSSGEATPDPKNIARSKVEIVNWTWAKEGFGNIMEATFTITNGSAWDVKDIEIKCRHYGKSGTEIDSNKRTIYDVIKSRETKTFEKFNMGFVHSQADKSTASIEDFELLGAPVRQ